VAFELNLHVLGLTAPQVELYRLLLVDGGGTSAALAARTDQPADQVEELLDGLRGLGLVEASAVNGDWPRRSRHWAGVLSSAQPTTSRPSCSSPIVGSPWCRSRSADTRPPPS